MEVKDLSDLTVVFGSSIIRLDQVNDITFGYSNLPYEHIEYFISCGFNNGTEKMYYGSKNDIFHLFEQFREMKFIDTLGISNTTQFVNSLKDRFKDSESYNSSENNEIDIDDEKTKVKRRNNKK